MKAAFERMKSEKCQGRSANYFGKGVGYQYAYVLALMRQNDEKYGLPPMDTIQRIPLAEASTAFRANIPIGGLRTEIR